MNKVVESKKGISLVALIITIIVMVILTSAVVMVGKNVPQGAQLAVFKANVATLQEAVTMKMLENELKDVNDGNKESSKWIGIIKDYDGSEEVNFNEGEVIAGRLALPLSEELRNNLNISAEELSKYYVTEEGKVYHIGFTTNGETYYNANLKLVEYTMSEVMAQNLNLTEGTVASISTAQELKDLATYTNSGNNTKGVTFKLTSDITLNENVLNADGTLNETNASSFDQWKPIGIATYINSVENYPVTFKGVIDGNNKTISGIYINDVTKFGAGFVSGLENGVIQNLTIANSYIYGERYVGGFVGGNRGGNIYNCASEDNLIVGNSFRIGGIIGFNKSGIVKNSHNTSKVVSNTTSEVGGIIGHMVNGIVDTCYNTGNISSASSASGGIVGKCTSYGANDSCYCKIINCYNLKNGKIQSKHAGGIVGVVGDGLQGAMCVDIINSLNDGTIGIDDKAAGGGICGYVTTDYGHDVTVNILNSYNSDQGLILSKSSVGGICGGQNKNSNATTYVNIYNAYNVGEIIDTSTSGGIDGQLYVSKNLKYCYNLFPLSTGGGISGSRASIYTIDSCYNIDDRRFAKEVTETNPGIIDSSQNLTPGVTINGTTHTTLLSALNAWVDANKSAYPELKNWVMGDNGYPVFVDSI